MARTLAITYGGVTVGLGATSAAFYLTDKFGFEHDRSQARLTMTVVVSAATAAAFETAEATLLGEFRKDDQALTVAVNGNRHSFDPATNSGLTARSSIRKLANATATATSAEYDISVICELPFDLAGRAGRRDATVLRVIDASEREIAIFRGEFTAQSGGNAAVAQHDAEVDTWINGILTAFGGSWNRTSRSLVYDDQDKVVRFESGYEKILANESLAGADLASVVQQQIRVRRSKFGDRRSSDPNLDSARPFERVAIIYRANIRSSVTTDLRTLYEGTIKPHMLAQVSGTVVVTRDQPMFDYANNVIESTIVGFIEASGLIESRLKVTRSVAQGRVLVPVWDGNPYSRRKYQDTVDEVWTVLVQTASTASAAARHEAAIPPKLKGQGFELIFTEHVEDAVDQGIDGFGTLQGIILESSQFVFVRADAPAGVAAAAGQEELDRPPTQPGFVAPIGAAPPVDAVVEGELQPFPFGQAAEFKIQRGF